MYFLCINSQFSVNKGDALTMMGSVCWAVQILCLERFSQKLDGIKFALFEFLTCSALSGIMMFIVERPSWQSIYAAALPLLYCGLLSVGVGFTAQIICVKYTDPVVASLIMSTESVFAAMLGWLVLGEHLSARQLFGGVLVFFAVILTQLPPRRRVKPRTTE
ncbi:MAG: DMT family transporter [Oscillospiraceae bacterium]